MRLRTLKHRHDARTTYLALLWAPDQYDVSYGPVEDDDGEDHYFHDEDGTVRDVTCRACDGTGGDRWNDGILPCEHCDGEGYEWWR